MVSVFVRTLLLMQCPEVVQHHINHKILYFIQVDLSLNLINPPQPIRVQKQYGVLEWLVQLQLQLLHWDLPLHLSPIFLVFPLESWHVCGCMQVLLVHLQLGLSEPSVQLQLQVLQSCFTLQVSVEFLVFPNISTQVCFAEMFDKHAVSVQLHLGSVSLFGQ